MAPLWPKKHTLLCCFSLVLFSGRSVFVTLLPLCFVTPKLSDCWAHNSHGVQPLGMGWGWGGGGGASHGAV